MKKFLTFLIAVVIALPTLLLIGCSGDHTHTFATEYSSDATHHWYACTVEDCTETKDKAEHTFDADTCTVCGYVDETLITTTTYHYAAPKTTNLQEVMGLKYEYAESTFALGNKMTISLRSNDTFELILENGDNYTTYETVVCGTYNEDSFEITEAIETQTVLGNTVYSIDVNNDTLKKKTENVRFFTINENYFVIQNFDFNFVFIKEGYTPVEGEKIIVNLPFRAISILNGFNDPLGLPYDISFTQLKPSFSEGGSITTVDENGELIYDRISEDSIVSLNGILVSNSTPSIDDDTLLVGDHKNVSISLDLNETKTDDKNDDTTIIMGNTKVVKISNFAPLCIHFLSSNRQYLIYHLPSTIKNVDEFVLYLETEGVYYLDSEYNEVLVSSEMVKEFDISLNNGTTAKISIEIPDMRDNSNKIISEFIVPIVEETTTVELVDMHIYSMGYFLTVELNGDMEEVIAECYIDLAFSDDSFDWGLIFDKIDSEKLTYTTVDTSTVGYKTITFTYEYAEGKTISETLLVVVYDPLADSITYTYGPDEIEIEIDINATPEEICEYLNNYTISLMGFTFDGEIDIDAKELDLNTVLGKAEITPADNLWLAELAENGFEFEVNVTVAGEGFGTYTYKQTISILFVPAE